MATLYIQYPQSGGGGTTGSQTGVPYNVGTLDSAAASQNGGVIGSFSLFFQSAQGNTPGLVSSITQSFAGVKKFSNPTLFSNGSIAAPGIAFTIESASGMYYIGTNSYAFAVSGIQAMNFVTSTGNGFANVGMGGAASTSPLFPLVVQRTQDGGFLTQALSNLSSVAGSGGRIQALVDNGANSAELIATSVNTAAPDVYAAGRAVYRATSNMSGLSMLADAAAGNVKVYIGGGAVNDIVMFVSSTVGIAAKTRVASPLLVLGSLSITSSTGAAAYALRLPGAQGTATQVMSNDGNGNLAWASVVTNPMTASGDLIIGSGAGTATRLALGTPFQMLGVSNTAAVPSWQTFGFGTFDSLTKSLNGGVIGSFSLFLQAADATNPGMVSSANQTFAGTKTFSRPIALAANGSATWAAGTLVFDNANNSPTFYNNISSISLQIGQEQWVMCYNNSSAAILNGRAVYTTGAFSGMPTIGLAQATTQSMSQLLGVATHDIANGGIGMVTQQGKVNGIDTSAYGAGQRVWLSASSAGFFQVTDPLPPSYSVFVGYTVDIGSTTGSLFLSGIRQGAQVPFVNPMTTSGDMIVGSGSGVATRIGLVGSAGMVLTKDSTSSYGVRWGSPQFQVTYCVPAGSNYVTDKNDQVVISSSTAGTGTAVRLPDPLRNPGARITVFYNGPVGSTDTLSVLCDVVGSTSLKYGATASTSFLLSTPGETIDVVAEQSGNGYRVLNHVATTPWRQWIPTNSQGLGSLTQVSLVYRRDGQDLLLMGSAVSGTGTAVEAQLSLPENYVSENVCSGTTLVGSVAIGNTAAAAIYAINDGGTNYLNFGNQSATTAGISKGQGTSIVANTTKFAINVRLPIVRWRN